MLRLAFLLCYAIAGAGADLTAQCQIGLEVRDVESMRRALRLAALPELSQRLEEQCDPAKEAPDAPPRAPPAKPKAPPATPSAPAPGDPRPGSPKADVAECVVWERRARGPGDHDLVVASFALHLLQIVVGMAWMVRLQIRRIRRTVRVAKPASPHTAIETHRDLADPLADRL